MIKLVIRKIDGVTVFMVGFAGPSHGANVFHCKVRGNRLAARHLRGNLVGLESHREAGFRPPLRSSTAATQEAAERHNQHAHCKPMIHNIVFRCATSTLCNDCLPKDLARTKLNLTRLMKSVQPDMPTAWLNSALTDSLNHRVSRRRFTRAVLNQLPLRSKLATPWG